jgi:hypothetical protein
MGRMPAFNAAREANVSASVSARWYIEVVPAHRVRCDEPGPAEPSRGAVCQQAGRAGQLIKDGK